MIATSTNGFFEAEGKPSDSGVRQLALKRPVPIRKRTGLKRSSLPDAWSSAQLSLFQERSTEPVEIEVSPTIQAAPSPRARADVDALPIEVWEGVVIHQLDAETLQVSLTPKIGSSPAHTAEIELQWVDEQDRDLIRPGAVFYLSLGKTSRGGSYENAQKIRFRRQPDWSARQVKKIWADVKILSGKIGERPTARD